MMFNFANFAFSKLISSITASETTMQITLGSETKFPNPTAPDVVPIFITSPSGQNEIVYCTNVTNNTLTIVRGREGTTPRAFAAGSIVEIRLNAAALQQTQNDIAAAFADLVAERILARNASNLLSGTVSVDRLPAFLQTQQPTLTHQQKVMELNVGFVGATNTELFVGASGSMQGFDYIQTVGGQDLQISLVRVGGSKYLPGEKCRLVQTNYIDTGATVTPTIWSNELEVGHGQDLTMIEENGSIFAYTTARETVGGTYGASKGFSKILYRGALTAQADVTNYVLFGAPGSNHPLQNYYQAVVAVSKEPGNKYLIVHAKSDIVDTHGVVFIYDRLAVEAAGVNSLDVKPLNSWPEQRPTYEDTEIRQGLACDGTRIMVLHGYFNWQHAKYVRIYDFNGNMLSQTLVTGPLAAYGRNNIMNHPSLGVPRGIEPEGMAIRNGQIHIGFIERWASDSDIVTYQGLNYACVTACTGIRPIDLGYWSGTNKPATRGDFNLATAYSPGATAGTTRRSKAVYKLIPENQGGTRISALDFYTQTSVIVTSSTEVDIAYAPNQSFQIKALNALTGKFLSALSYINGQKLAMYDINDPLARYSSITRSTDDDGVGGIMVIRALGGRQDEGAWLDLKDYNRTANAGEFRGGTTKRDKTVITNLSFDPNTPDDGYIEFGHGATRRLLASKFRPERTALSGVQIADAATGGNASATPVTGFWTQMGESVTICATANNIVTTGLTATNNLMIRGFPAPVVSQPISVTVTDFTFGATTVTMNGLISNIGGVGVVQIYEMTQAAVSIISNVNKVINNVTNIRIAGSYIV
jgi:hypothetical protein